MAAIEFATTQVCGALGCHVTEPLVRITIDGRTRTLCMHCASDYTTAETTQ